MKNDSSCYQMLGRKMNAKKVKNVANYRENGQNLQLYVTDNETMQPYLSLLFQLVAALDELF